MTAPITPSAAATTPETNGASNGNALIHVDGIKKIFYRDEVETQWRAGVHLEVQPGEYLAIAGASGGGKTTLLSILGLLDTPSEGEYMLDGHPVAQLTASQRARSQPADQIHLPGVQPDR